jgi:hypothetical protein
MGLIMKSKITDLLKLLFIFLCISEITAQNYNIPFEIQNNRPIILVSVNNSKPLPFIFDTGASILVISDSVFQMLKLEDMGKVDVGSPNATNTIEAVVTSIDSITIGEYKSKELNAISFSFSLVLPDLEIAGIIGPKVFSNKLISLNYNNSELKILDGNLNKDDKNIIEAKLQPIISIDVKLNNKTYEGHLDSGSQYFINIPYEWKNNLEFYSAPVESDTGSTVSGEFIIYKAKLKGAISIGNISITDPEVNLVTGGFNIINFGSQFLRNYEITIDNKLGLIKMIQAQ